MHNRHPLIWRAIVETAAYNQHAYVALGTTGFWVLVVVKSADFLLVHRLPIEFLVLGDYRSDL